MNVDSHPAVLRRNVVGILIITNFDAKSHLIENLRHRNNLKCVRVPAHFRRIPSLNKWPGQVGDHHRTTRCPGRLSADDCAPARGKAGVDFFEGIHDVANYDPDIRAGSKRLIRQNKTATFREI